MLTIMIIFTSLMFCLMSHPLALGLTLLVQTIFIALMSGTMSINFWFSYIIFLIMIGGMLVLFVYMTSIAANEKFSFSLSMTVMLIMVVMISLWATLIDPMTLNLPTQLMENMPSMMNKNYSLILNKYMNLPHSMIYILMVIYLLITLIAIVKITIKSKSTLRQNF
uniref:NADH-ubiquinone oxidoreductase chain 6 n=1 Tax=Smaragdina concolor TaxID=294642 RepID=A0A3G1GST1_9CUCU|nr:NADH dehydrogenase subunit 6 [Smaragdina concolor]